MDLRYGGELAYKLKSHTMAYVCDFIAAGFVWNISDLVEIPVLNQIVYAVYGYICFCEAIITPHISDTCSIQDSF